jgi:Ni/Fe-hydrogenase subunit HybB-like protein
MSAPAQVIHSEPAPVGGALLTRGTLIVGVFAALGVLAIMGRLAFGLGATTALTDDYPWGLWIAFDVVVGTALACGGYAMAILVYVLNRGQYHPLVRPALLTSAFGYTMAGLSVMLDVGRYWAIWKVPLFFWEWNLNSVLLEVALCIMAYVFVLWLELSPAFLARGASARNERLRAFSRRALPVMNKALIWIIALGMLLPTMHQSSLGSLMMLTGPRLHPLWQSPLLPLLFLVSCIGMGYAAVVIEGAISALVLRRSPERTMLANLGAAMIPVFVLYLVLRLGDLAWRGQLAALFAFDFYSVLALVELTLFAAAPVMLASEARRRDLGNLFRAAMVLIGAGALYRFNTFLIAFNVGSSSTYFPSVAETLITVGLIAIEVLGYIAIVKYFPILTAQPPSHPLVKAA